MPPWWPDPASLMPPGCWWGAAFIPCPCLGILCVAPGVWVSWHPTPWHVSLLSLLVSLLLHQRCPAPALLSSRVPAAGAISIHVVGLLLSLSRLSGQTEEICPSKNENHLSQGSSSLVRVVSLPAQGMTNGSQPSLCNEKGLFG